MTITITYTDGTSGVYTNCSDLSITGGVVQFSGTNAAGEDVSAYINWSTVKKIETVATP